MPLLLQKNISSDCILAIWHILETQVELLNLMGTNYKEDLHLERIMRPNAKHYLASRIILTHLFPNHQIELFKNTFNKPSLKIDGKDYSVSITHSFDYAGILLTENGDLGIDLEKIDARIGRVKRKFMNETEMEFAGKEEQISEQTLIWCAKETLYKLYGNKELDFKENLFIHSFLMRDTDVIETHIKKDNFYREVKIDYQIIDNYILTYCKQQIHLS